MVGELYNSVDGTTVENLFFSFVMTHVSFNVGFSHFCGFFFFF